MKLLKHGASGSSVLSLQKRLNYYGFSCSDDGIFGRETASAVANFQKSRGLDPDGVAGRLTHQALFESTAPEPLKVTSNKLSGNDISSAASDLGVDVATIVAVLKVESRGDGFFSEGKPAILYERHVMARRLLANGVKSEDIKRYMRLMPLTVSKRTGGYQGGSKEYDRLFIAKAVHFESALESCSWGLFQIMGYHWKRLGYSGISDFVECMSRSEYDQLIAFVRFIKSDSRLHKALKVKSWAKFARRYNGKNYRKNKYAEKLSTAYRLAVSSS